eukprot:gnl/TRDRNA2_/TRDRNA2_31198_c0_seq1.p1 gnl/TRDRNA2_/TRDRNA2_31198_c0~~gnl/TRDRNA2_/TRDRNA2_31198_c0_seq1.p1  ORF type:complete len:100 (+),score=11.23 gnl/TRDRNA2_/TRDRNA2_31198_c0_seq1:1-300(+)
MVGSPLFTVKDAYYSKNAELMGSFSMNVATFLCTLVWTIEGYIYLDKPQIYVQNGTGVLANSLALLVRLHVNRMNAKRRPSDDDLDFGNEIDLADATSY